MDRIEKANEAYQRLQQTLGQVECWCGSYAAAQVDASSIMGLKVVQRRDMPPAEIWFVKPNVFGHETVKRFTVGQYNGAV